MEYILFLYIFFTIFILLVIASKKRLRKQKSLILKEIDDSIKLSINHIKCSSFTNGLRNGNHLIKNCDIYVTEDAIILFANGISPIIFTQNMTYRKFYFAEIHSTYNIIFNKTNSYVIIKFGNASISSTYTEIILKTLTDIEKKEIQTFVHPLSQNEGQ